LVQWTCKVLYLILAAKIDTVVHCTVLFLISYSWFNVLVKFFIYVLIYEFNSVKSIIVSCGFRLVALIFLTKVWRYQRGNQKPSIEMDRQHNGLTKKNKSTNNDLQNFTQKTKDRATWTPHKQGLVSGVKVNVARQGDDGWLVTPVCFVLFWL
jgi:hypothetical protein